MRGQCLVWVSVYRGRGVDSVQFCVIVGKGVVVSVCP